jgi:endonuclease/exonuclease/phosphatase family metal-dependent hydrolase
MQKSFFRRFSKKIFISLNIITAVLYFIGSNGKLFFSPTIWPVGLLSLGAIYLLLALLVFFIFWLFLKSKWSILFIITLLLTFNTTTQLIPLRFSSTFTKEKVANSIRVMSWNVAQFDILNFKKRPYKKNDMLNIINQYQPDIACFQEMVAGDTLINMNTPYYKKYSFFPIYNFVEQLKMPNYFYSYNFKEDFLAHQHFGIITFSKYPIINQQKVCVGNCGYNDFFQYTDIVKNADTFRVINVHLQSLKFSQSNLNYIDNPTAENNTNIEKSKSVIKKFKIAFTKRKLQADKVREVIDASPYKVIVCGDFNDVPNSYAYQTIGENLQNVFAKKGVGIGRTFSFISPTLRIDNIFVADKIEVLQYQRIPKFLSDHYPIMADIAVTVSTK